MSFRSQIGHPYLIHSSRVNHYVRVKSFFYEHFVWYKKRGLLLSKSPMFYNFIPLLKVLLPIDLFSQQNGYVAITVFKY